MFNVSCWESSSFLPIHLHSETEGEGAIPTWDVPLLEQRERSNGKAAGLSVPLLEVPHFGSSVVLLDEAKHMAKYDIHGMGHGKDQKTLEDNNTINLNNSLNQDRKWEWGGGSSTWRLVVW